MNCGRCRQGPPSERAAVADRESSFLDAMKGMDILKLLTSPFRRRTLTCRPELPARMTEGAPAEPRSTPPDSISQAEVVQ